MAITLSRAPISPAASSSASSRGISAVTPSSENRFAPQVARLQNLLEQIRADQPLEYFPLVHRKRRTFETLRNPVPPLRLRQVHEFRAHGSAINAAGLFSSLAGQFSSGAFYGFKKAKRIEVGFVKTPATKRSKTCSRSSLFAADFFDPLTGFAGRSSVSIVRSAINLSLTTFYFATERVFLFFRAKTNFRNTPEHGRKKGPRQQPKWRCFEVIFGGDSSAKDL